MGCGSPSKHQATTPTLETPLKPTAQGLFIPPLPLKQILGQPEPLPQQLLSSASVGLSSSSVLSGELAWKAGTEEEHGIFANLQKKAISPQGQFPAADKDPPCCRPET